MTKVTQRHLWQVISISAFLLPAGRCALSCHPERRRYGAKRVSAVVEPVGRCVASGSTMERMLFSPEILLGYASHCSAVRLCYATLRMTRADCASQENMSLIKSVLVKKKRTENVKRSLSFSCQFEYTALWQTPFGAPLFCCLFNYKSLHLFHLYDKRLVVKTKEVSRFFIFKNVHLPFRSKTENDRHFSLLSLAVGLCILLKKIKFCALFCQPNSSNYLLTF